MNFKYISPWTCAYYLEFLCYYDLHRFENRDRALEKLVDAVQNDLEDDGGKFSRSFTGLNIAGHCLLLAGQTSRARDMFVFSFNITHACPCRHKENSAVWYLLNFF